MPFSKAFYMIRHGETVANAADYTAGTLDVDLTPKGKRQAEQARDILAQCAVKPDAIFHSSLSRTKITAEIINDGLSLPLFENEKLHEQNLGDWQGIRSWHDIQKSMKDGLSPPNGETLPSFYARAIEGIRNVLATDFKRPLIISHGGIFDAVWDAANLPENDVKNCVLYDFQPRKSGDLIVKEIKK